MQRCIGAILTVLEGVIVNVEQCPHCRIDDAGNLLQPSCARLKVIRLPDGYKPPTELQTAFEEARSMYLDKLDDLEDIGL